MQKAFFRVKIFTKIKLISVKLNFKKLNLTYKHLYAFQGEKVYL